MNDTLLTVVSAVLPAEKLNDLFELMDPDINLTSYTDAETGECHVDIFLEDAKQAPFVQNSIRQTAALLGLDIMPSLSTMAREDWTEGWKRFFHVEHVSRRIVIRPSWEAYTQKPDEIVITLEPGLSFGTGKHATTQGCLQYLDQLADEGTDRNVLDMGCGSGILSIGAILLGFRDVRAFDIDPDCIHVSRDNAVLNHVAFPVEEGDLSHPWPKTEIVVANILAPILIEFASQVAASVAPGGRLILSGILETQYPSVREAYEKEGMKELSSLLIGEWKCGLFTC